MDSKKMHPWLWNRLLEKDFPCPRPTIKILITNLFLILSGSSMKLFLILSGSSKPNCRASRDLSKKSIMPPNRVLLVRVMAFQRGIFLSIKVDPSFPCPRTRRNSLWVNRSWGDLAKIFWGSSIQPILETPLILILSIKETLSNRSENHPLMSKSTWNWKKLIRKITLQVFLETRNCRNAITLM